MKKRTKTKSSGKTQTPTKERTFVALLLDRTGSMLDVKAETISGFNNYLDELQKRPESADITFDMTQFDNLGIDVMHDCVPLSKVTRLNNENYKPRDWTNFYDALGKTIRRIEEKAKDHKVLFVTITDGKENSSREWTKEMVLKLIREKENQEKWTFSYIGIGPEAWAANAAFSAGTIGGSNNLRATRGKNTQKAYSMMVGATMMRCSTAGGQSIGSLYAGKHLDTEEEET